MGSSKKVVQRERRAFTAEFKAEAVRLAAARRADGASLTQIGRELEVRPDQLRAWTRLHLEASGEGSAPPGETLEQRIGDSTAEDVRFVLRRHCNASWGEPE